MAVLFTHPETPEMGKHLPRAGTCGERTASPWLLGDTARLVFDRASRAVYNESYQGSAVSYQPPVTSTQLTLPSYKLVPVP